MLLNKDELFELMKLLGQSPNDQDFNYEDKEKKSVSLPEFVKLMNNKISKIDEIIYEAFRLFDTDGSGYISPEELRLTLLQLSNGYMSLDEIVDLVQSADTDQDGQINIEEFMTRIYPEGYTINNT